ncbi:SMP-30/gluconolactonase/LRE family protein [Plantibacter sp. VKM Ac-2880]|uniref:SMP-30/gluconolactonase/LRE family protein n=1 Tax=Plantibacter sp. VKM Ac-2880 TaxID=2783827 RepID=UPI00188F80DF|nr:SMP-30/gluconolactonase/LRE family protein [Plantibacter sp. VKM Ac-2880]MBF4567888.1 SMP-30/gluconolactonase/LRE family protein [Plantibacter sp. VKM Ac-2880]
MDVQPQVFRDTPAILVESIWWDDRTDELVWVDIAAGTLHRGPIDGAVDGSDDRVTELPPPLSAVQPRVGSGYIAALGDRIATLDEDGRIDETLAWLDHAHAGMRSNEAKVDPFGRFLVGSMNATTGEPDAALYLLDDTGLRTLLGGFGVANGFEWSDDGRTVYLTDTAVKTVYRAAYGEDGRLGPLEPFLVDYDSDGLALDTEGRFWNGVSGAGTVLRWGPDGAVEDRLAVPVPGVTSVAFGGPDLSTLFVGTSRDGLSEDELERAPLSGAIFRFDGLATGRPVNTYGRRSTSAAAPAGTPT